MEVGLGAAEVYNTYEEGGNWIRKAFEETGEMAGSFIGGTYVAEEIILALGFVPGPGWVILIGLGSAIALGYTLKWAGGRIYDTELGNIP
ncbi:MAG: hypothetical protein JSR33_04035 [Proteobacteria bacterium]|nr:hypothetical protein [Pseudomonadota bacterium]